MTAVSPQTRSPAATAREREQFAEQGYLILPGLLPDDLVERLRSETDRWVDEGLREKSIACCVEPEANGLPPLLELEMAAHGELTGHQPLLELLARLMGPEFVFHHLHSNRLAPGAPGKPWHHDYEQRPQTDRALTMVHALHYLDGLEKDTASLVVLPGSHREIAGKADRAHLGTRRLPGEVVIDDLPRGSTILMHSALFHARRARSDEADRPRYMVDASYCQVGAAWPPVKPFWRHVLRRARELELDRGRWPELFAERHFTEYAGPN